MHGHNALHLILLTGRTLHCEIPRHAVQLCKCSTTAACIQPPIQEAAHIDYVLAWLSVSIKVFKLAHSPGLCINTASSAAHPGCVTMACRFAAAQPGSNAKRGTSRARRRLLLGKMLKRLMIFVQVNTRGSRGGGGGGGG